MAFNIKSGTPSHRSLRCKIEARGRGGIYDIDVIGFHLLSSLVRTRIVLWVSTEYPCLLCFCILSCVILASVTVFINSVLSYTGRPLQAIVISRGGYTSPALHKIVKPHGQGKGG